MSLDVYLTTQQTRKRESSGIFIRENGSTHEISQDEWNERYPGLIPAKVVDENETNEIYSANITHNLNGMAGEAGIYQHLWRPDEIGITKAQELIEPFRIGLVLLKTDPDRFKIFNAPNGWGIYENFVLFVEKYLQACIDNPDADVSVSR